MPVGHKDHRGIPVAVAVALGRGHQSVDFSLVQVFASAQYDASSMNSIKKQNRRLATARVARLNRR